MQSKERPMLFSTDMVAAILEDRKTMTRRTKGLERIERVNGIKTMTFPKTGETVTYVDAAFTTFDVQINSGLIACPYGAIGDLLWVRETWASISENEITVFKADYNGEPVAWNWRPSIHLRKDAARIWLQITDIRVERIQDIEEDYEEAMAEGIRKISHGREGYYYHHHNTEPSGHNWISPCRAFRDLWESINGEQSWKQNPWVWVISFKVLSKTGKPKDISGFQTHESLKSSPSGTKEQQVEEAHLLPGNGEGKGVLHG